MRCFIENIATSERVSSDIRELVPDAGLRRRMSRVMRFSVMTAVECAGGVGGTGSLDAVITATGLGCLADSERFLRNMIADNEQMLNPAPFIYSTFNSVGGTIAMLRRNHCYNVTYVNRSHGFEDALLDAVMRISDAESSRVLVGAFDEQTPSQCRIMERMGLWRKESCCEGAVFTTLTAEPSERSRAELVRLEFLPRHITDKECMERYSGGGNTVLLTNDVDDMGLFPVGSARLFARGVQAISDGAGETLIYNGHGGSRPTIMVLRCIGY